MTTAFFISVPAVKKKSELVKDTSRTVNGRLLFTCRTGNEKRRLILKSLIQNLKIQTPVRNSLVSFLCCILHFCVSLSFRFLSFSVSGQLAYVCGGMALYYEYCCLPGTT